MNCPVGKMPLVVAARLTRSPAFNGTVVTSFEHVSTSPALTAGVTVTPQERAVVTPFDTSETLTIVGSRLRGEFTATIDTLRLLPVHVDGSGTPA
jgi:hypothetical protein